jgi:ribokinase
MQPGGPYTAAPVPGQREDAYGCGDSFMAGLTYALAADIEPHEAVAFAARCGAAALTGRGVSPQPVAL